MNTKSDSEGEFEDAVDSLPFSPQHNFSNISFPSHQQLPTTDSSNPSNIPFPTLVKTEREFRRGFMQPNGNVGNSDFLMNTPSTSNQNFGMPTSARSAMTRHGRLEILRNRMKQEFGPISSSYSLQYDGGQDDLSSQRSDCTSLASWGRNLLMERNADNHFSVIQPTDSLSTRATPEPDYVENNVRAEGDGPDLFGIDDKSDASNSLKKDNLDSRFLFNDYSSPQNNDENWNHVKESSAPIHFDDQHHSVHNKQSLSPPVHPPPPLPNFCTSTPCTSSTELINTSLSPPPLPPRRTSVVAPKLPTAILSVATTSDEQQQQQRYQSVKILDNNSTVSGQFQQNCSISPKRNYSESCESTKKTYLTADNYGVKRGHAKTNSLDRGLSLAKSMKSGPFPPPASSKSNSLNRDVTPSDALAACEEDQRITSAHGVIQQLTFSVLSTPSNGSLMAPSTSTVPLMKHEPGHRTKEALEAHNNATSILLKNPSDSTESSFFSVIKYPSQSAAKHLAVVGEEAASISSSTSIRSSSTITKQTKPIANPHYENLTIEPNVVFTKELTKDANVVSTSFQRPVGDSVEFNSSPNLSCIDELKNEVIKKGRSLSREPSNNDEPSSSRTCSHMDSIDPVTRDVQRRMSLSSLASFQNKSSVSNSAKSGIHHVKNAARSYGTAASGFLRGAVQQVKTAVVFNKPSKVVVASKEDDSTDSDEVTTSISDALPTATKMSVQASNITEPPIICRPKNAKKGPFDFEQLRIAQEISNEHTGAVWCIKFSVCGRLFATAGQDNIVRVWVLKNYLNYFTRMRERYSQDGGVQQNILDEKSSRFSTMHDDDIENLRLQEELKNYDATNESTKTSDSASAMCSNSSDSSATSNLSASVVVPKPFCVFRGHTADVLDLSWSPRNYFILSCGIDRTVKLWHLTRNECLCCFQHMDFVTCIAFMPKDDRYFISGSLDGKIRLWHIPEKKVALWNEVEQVKFITAITFVRNGKFVVVGTYNGRCFFYSTDQLKYHTVIDVRSTRGKNARGHKITSLAVHGDKLLVTSNDSRIRIYDLRDMDLTCKFKGAQIERSQIRASFSPDGRHIISGSEDNYIYIWRTNDLLASISVRKDRNPMWERVRAHNSVVTAAVFAPKPNLFLTGFEENWRDNGITNNFITNSSRTNNSHGRSSIVSSLGVSGNNGLDSCNGGRNRNSLTLSTNFTSSLISNSLSHSASGNCSISGNETNASNDIQKVNAVNKVNPKSGSSRPDSVGFKGHAVVVGNGSSSGVSSSSGELVGDVIVSADLSGSLKIFLNPTKSYQTGSSNFFSR